MKIELTKIKVSELFDGFVDNNEEGVRGFHGLLNIRPPYQREFVYKDKQRDAVIDTINKGFPLNTMYWVKNEDGTYELLDGQQRTLSICQYLNGDYSIKSKAFHNLYPSEREKILNYELMVYVCEGDELERLDWFRTINIAGEKLTDQELLNINYIGAWLADAKRKFSKTNCVAYKLGNKYVKGSPIRQEYLETALDWISEGNIADYMSDHQHDATATELWGYFQNVISWVEDMFPTYRKEMQSVNWGELYNKYHTNRYNPADLEAKVRELMANEEVTDKKGIYEYVLSNEDIAIARKLSKRAFSERDKRTVYERQGGVCPICGEHHDFSEMEGDHITPWWRGGSTTIDNLQMLCKACNSGKSGKAKLAV